MVTEQEEKIRISVIMYGGLSYGGAHRQVIRLLCNLDKSKFDITYFWCVPKQDTGSTFVWPELDYNNISLLESSGVKVVEFHANGRDVRKKHHPWIDTNFFDLFHESDYDLVFASRAGYPEYPFTRIAKPIIEWNVFGCVDNSSNLVYSVHSSDWTYGNWKSQAPACHGEVVYPSVPMPALCISLRADLAIPDDEIVFGFHQRVDDHIYGEQALRAYALALPRFQVKTRFLILGGSGHYKSLAAALDVPVIFLPVTKDYEGVSKFLNTLNIFAHSGGAGETLAITIQEAMIHGKAIITMDIPGKPNGQIGTMRGKGFVANNVEHYSELMLNLAHDVALRTTAATEAVVIAERLYSNQAVAHAFEKIFTEKYNEFKRKPIKISKSIYLNDWLESHQHIRAALSFVTSIFRRPLKAILKLSRLLKNFHPS